MHTIVYHITARLEYTDLRNNFRVLRAVIPAFFDVPICWPHQACSDPCLRNVESLFRCRRDDWSLQLYTLAVIRSIRFYLGFWIAGIKGSDPLHVTNGFIPLTFFFLLNRAFQYRRILSKKRMGIHTKKILTRERQFDELSFKGSLVAERKLGTELWTPMLTIENALVPKCSNFNTDMQILKHLQIRRTKPNTIQGSACQLVHKAAMNHVIMRQLKRLKKMKLLKQKPFLPQLCQV